MKKKGCPTMLDLEHHPYFKPYTDEQSGVTSYFLTEKVAQIQQQFYFTNTSLTFDSKYLWFNCMNAPSHAISVGVLSMDPSDPWIRNFPQTAQFNDGVPGIIPGTHDLLVPVRDAMYRLSLDGEMKKVFALDPDFLNFRAPERMCTHTSLSCDGKRVILDIGVAGNIYIATGNIETGEVKQIYKFGRCYDHAMFSPVEPNLFMIDQEWWRDYHSGEYFPIDNRTWLMNTDGTMLEPLLPKAWSGHNDTEIAHDFFAKDGMMCWVDYDHGAFECDVNTREVTHVWKRPLCHSHTSPDRKYWCGDYSPYFWHERPCKTLFFDRESGKEIDIFTALPEPHVKRGGAYHLDPHPAFTDDGKYIISTVTLLDGNADIAITPVEPLIELCRRNGRPAV